jgi:DMSO/TMAO reductase YedYZ molybdopterin-dependent catalytic subunit
VDKQKIVNLKRFFVGGILGGILATIILFIGTEFFEFPFPPLVIFQLIISPVPGSIQSVMVETFREYAKYSAFVMSSVIYALLYGVIAVFLGLLVGGDMHGKGKANKVTLLGVIIPTVIGILLQLQLANAFPVISTAYGWMFTSLLLVAANIVYSTALIRYTIVVPIEPTNQMPARTISARRGFLKKAVIAVAVLAVAGIATRIGLSLLSNQPVVTSGTSVPVNPQPTEITADVPNIFRDSRISDLLGSEVTDNRVFYRVDINPIPPRLDSDKWSLNVHGKVNTPLVLDKNSFNKLPTIDQYATLECVSNTISPPGSLISNAKWTGVPLASLLNQVGFPASAKYVIFRCGDGYSVGVPIERALNPGALLAYKMNDETLPDEHGFPLRAIVPGIYGMMNAKWITEIEVTDQVYLGYWQERGWSNDARIKTTSIIYYPSANARVNGTIPIAGVAFAGDRGISKVEVSVDGGNNWNEAILKQPRSAYSWVLWAYEWTPTATGTVNIITRAYDGKGQLQDRSVVQPFPDGASGYQSNQVTVA